MIELILLERVEKLGQMGQIVKVRPGYARNFLLPQKKAMRATKDNLAYFETQRAQLEANNLTRKSDAGTVAEKLEGATLRISQKSGVDGRLFGSVTNVDIVDALQGLGHTVEKSMVRMPEGPLKHVGDFPLVIALHTDVT